MKKYFYPQKHYSAQLLKATISFIFIITFLQSHAQTINWMWAKNVGGSLEEVGEDVVTDSNGNVYLTGYFASSSITFW